MLALTIFPFTPLGTSRLYTPGGPAGFSVGLVRRTCTVKPLLVKLVPVIRGTKVLLGKNHSPTAPPLGLSLLSPPLQQSVLTLVVTHINELPGARLFPSGPTSEMSTESPVRYTTLFSRKYRPVVGGAKDIEISKH